VPRATPIGRRGHDGGPIRKAFSAEASHALCERCAIQNSVPAEAGRQVMMSRHARFRAGVAQLAERQPSKPLDLCAVLARVEPRA
jgi:hypothetical protein